MYFVRWYECNWRYHWAGSKCVSFWFVGLGLVDCPTQLICTWIFICWVGGGYSIQGLVKCLSPYFTQDWAFLTNFFAKYTCHQNKWELEAKNWFIEVKNMPKKRSFLKSFHKRASLKSGIPETHFRDSWIELAWNTGLKRGPETRAWNTGLKHGPETRAWNAGIQAKGWKMALFGHFSVGFHHFFCHLFAFTSALCMQDFNSAKKISPIALFLTLEHCFKSSPWYRGFPPPAV